MSFWIITFAVIVAIVLLFAIISNILMIFCVATYKRLRTFTNVFICNLSISDILLAGVVMPQNLHHLFHKEDFYEGNVLCKISNFGPVFIITSSIYTLVVVSFERRKTIMESHVPKMTGYMLFVLILCIWVLSLIVSLPTLMEYDIYVELNIVNETVNIVNETVNIVNETVNIVNETVNIVNETVNIVHETVNIVNETVNTEHNAEIVLHYHCESMSSSEYALFNAIFVFSVSYVIPVILMLKNYLEIALFVWRKGRAQRDHISASGNNNSSFQLFKHRTKLIKMFVMVAVIFAVSWFPYFMLLLFAKKTGNDASRKADGFANLFLIALATFSTAYNVVLYVVFNPSVKRAMEELLKCKKKTDLRAIANINETYHTRISPDEVLPDTTVTNKHRIFLVQPIPTLSQR